MLRVTSLPKLRDDFTERGYSVAYTNPITIAIWLALSSAFIQFMQWWPGGNHGLLEYLKPIPAFGHAFASSDVSELLSLVSAQDGSWRFTVFLFVSLRWNRIRTCVTKLLQL